MKVENADNDGYYDSNSCYQSTASSDVGCPQHNLDTLKIQCRALQPPEGLYWAAVTGNLRELPQADRDQCYMKGQKGSAVLSQDYISVSHVQACPVSAMCTPETRYQ